MLKLITLLLTSSMTVMAGATISPALPQIGKFFAAEPNAEFWVKLLLTLPALFTAIAAPFAGLFIDRVGRKPLLAAAVALYGFAGGSGFGLSTLPSLLLGRALLGVAVGAIMTTSTALIADYYQGAKRNQVMGVQAAFMGFGGVAFLTLGGFLADLGWRFPFLIYLSAFAVLPLVLICLDEPDLPRRHSRATIADNPVQTEREPLPLAILVTVYGLTFVTMLAFYLIPVQIPFYLKQLEAVSSVQTGLAIAAATLASATMSLNYRRIKARLSFTGILVGVYVLMCIGYLIVARGTTYFLVLVGLIIAGLGLGLVMPNMNVWLNATVLPNLRGRALGGLTTAMFLGQFCSPIVSQPLTAQFGLSGTYGVTGVMLGLLAGLIASSGVMHRAATKLKRN